MCSLGVAGGCMTNSPLAWSWEYRGSSYCRAAFISLPSDESRRLWRGGSGVTFHDVQMPFYVACVVQYGRVLF